MRIANIDGRLALAVGAGYVDVAAGQRRRVRARPARYLRRLAGVHEVGAFRGQCRRMPCSR